MTISNADSQNNFFCHRDAFCSFFSASKREKSIHRITLRGQSVHWIGAQFCVCLFVPGLQKIIFKHVPKCKWIPLAKDQWIPRTNECNVNFVGTFVVSRIPQQTNIVSCSGVRNFRWIPKNVSGIRQCNLKRILKAST